MSPYLAPHPGKTRPQDTAFDNVHRTCLEQVRFAAAPSTTQLSAGQIDAGQIDTGQIDTGQIDTVICHCYSIMESEVRQTIEESAAGTVEEVVQVTCAGTGCTACHCRIRQLLQTSRLARRAS